MNIAALALLLALTIAHAGAALTHAIPPGLAYVRVGELPQDAEAIAAALASGAVVLDLRYAKGNAAAADALDAALAETARRSKALRLILLNSDTAPELRKAALRPRPRQLTVAPRSEDLPADITVNVSAADERAAYEALAAGTPLDKLINNTSEKRRFDEAALTRSHANGSTPSTDDEAEEDGDEEPEEKEAEKPVVDVVLQRAVQLQRTLQSRLP